MNESKGVLPMRAALLAGLFSIQQFTGQASGEPLAANPGKTLVSTPSFTPVGYLCRPEQRCDALSRVSSRTSVNEVLFEFFSFPLNSSSSTASEPFVHYRADNQTANGTAEVFVGLQGVAVAAKARTSTENPRKLHSTHL